MAQILGRGLFPPRNTIPRASLYPIASFAGRSPSSSLSSLAARSMVLLGFPSQQNRRCSTMRDDQCRTEMEVEKKELEFNKKRAEGNGSRSPKTLQLKSRKLNPVSTTCYAQILGTGMDTQDTSPSVLLFFDKQRFIFNAGEGLQRFCTDHKIKLSKLDHMFLTRVCSETAGGLPGLLLTLAGIGEKGMSVNVWGPSDLRYLVDAIRSFIPNAAVVHTHSFGEDWNKYEAISNADQQQRDPIVLIDDEVVRISAIPLRPFYWGTDDILFDSKSSHLTSSGKNNSTQLSGSLETCSEKMNGLSSSTVKPGDIAVVYVCELPEVKGKFDPDKAKSLGLKCGPKYGQLQCGNSVESDLLDIMVHPNDVLGPSSPGPILLLVDCPTPFHMKDLFSNLSLECYYIGSSHQPGESLKSVNCIIHMGPSTVTKSPEYHKWMKRFGNAEHIMAGHEMRNLEIPILKSSAKLFSKLNYLCPRLFPASGYSLLQQIEKSSLKLDVSHDSASTCESRLAENLLKFHLRPLSHLGLDRSTVPESLSQADIINELVLEIPEIVDVSSSIREIWKSCVEDEHMGAQKGHILMVEEPREITGSCLPSSSEGVPEENTFEESSDVPSCLQNISREDMEIVLLGTGSSQPSKYRNVSSVLVNLFAKGGLLLDCGEGTLAQLKRRFGLKGADDVVKSLKCIWISHIHADHHTGLARILALRSQLLKDIPHEPLLVIGPRPLKRFLDAYSRLEELDMKFLDCRDTTEISIDQVLGYRDISMGCSFGDDDKNGSSTRQHTLRRLLEVLSEAGLKVLFSVPVVHCPHAFGVVVEAADRINTVGEVIPGWKLVYSGDTRPCQALIDASRDATLLIHEATFEDSLQDEAVARNHSTTAEAIAVGASAGAYRVVLTHFSQRYPKVPVLDDDDAGMHNAVVAFDLMSINAADLPLLPRVLPFLKVLFRDEMAADDESDDLLDSSAAAAL